MKNEGAILAEYAHLHCLHCQLHSGRHVQIQLNCKTGVLVVDVVREDERGGNECIRRNLNQIPLPSDEELLL